MKLISQRFETPVSEDASWLTNIIVSDNGNEQRIALLDAPVRSLQPTWKFGTEAEARAMGRALFMSQTGFLIPAWHLSAKVAPAAIGAVALAFDRLGTELRDGAQALVFDPRSDAAAVVALAIVAGAGATLARPLAAAIGPGWRVCPLWAMVGADNLSLSRARLNGSGSATISMRQLEFVEPYLNPANAETLPAFAGLPLLNSKPMGATFDTVYNTGATLIDYGAAALIRSRWKHTQIQVGRDFLCQRILNAPDWHRWQAFLAYCQGSARPFYMPTMRPDFAIVGVAAGNSVTLKGLDYAQDYAGNQAFAQLSVYSSAGRHDTKVTAITSVGGNSVCTIDPPLPNGPGYATEQQASLLLKCRIADDKVSFQHDALQTTITLNIRTIDA